MLLICDLINKFGCRQLKNILYVFMVFSWVLTNIFRLSNTFITSKSAKVLFETIKNVENAPIVNINLNNCEIDDDCVESLGEYLQKNETIESIDLGKYEESY